ncbi:hypothetical protein WJ048_00265 [Listeria welshimeri]|uniref:TIGR04197 family type VII secretion effector n=2 Tax=Listeria welshimeri TaxID=1643 RepID=A0A7X0T5M5_LISWE|nr:hypothetical protein [Listeria welshimeri]MBC1322190.1 hypothetical protein [Listeria welshimeri]MBC1620000.1 hypothetical protein [Listeria welshimeri]MBC1939554.1 hypothetical protein [Listeria welshimeri]MBF2484724.1 hypothetical protein [Listeria welshimeri]CAK19472.1 hypothetical protein lwe0054 [Listeria welshimeri serovar 6b str. SLCC5334]
MSEIKVNRGIVNQTVSKGKGILSTSASPIAMKVDKTNINPFKSNSDDDTYKTIIAELFRLVRYSEQSLNEALGLVDKTVESMEQLDKEIGNGIASKNLYSIKKNLGVKKDGEKN